MTERFLSVKTLVKDDPDGPHVNLGADLWRGFTDDEAFGWKVPVGSCPLASQVHPLLWVIILLVHDLGKTEIRYFNITRNVPASQQNVPWLEIVMDYGWFDFV